jgi:hypothetical protein
MGEREGIGVLEQLCLGRTRRPGSRSSWTGRANRQRGRPDLVKVTVADIASALRRTWLLLKGLLANFVIVPLIRAW